MKSKPSLIALFGALATAFTTVAAGPDPSQIYVQSITYGGTGSPQGSVGQSISNDRTTFTLIFDQFVASKGPGVPVTESRKDSQINLAYNSPKQGKMDVDIRGYVGLPAGATATVSVAAYDEKGKATTTSETFSGPISKDYLLHAKAKLHAKGDVGVSNLKVQISLSGPNSDQAQITVDSLDGKVHTPGNN